MALEAEAHRESISEAIKQSRTAQQFLSPGRVVVVRSESVSKLANFFLFQRSMCLICMNALCCTIKLDYQLHCMLALFFNASS